MRKILIPFCWDSPRKAAFRFQNVGIVVPVYFLDSKMLGFEVRCLIQESYNHSKMLGFAIFGKILIPICWDCLIRNSSENALVYDEP